MTREPIGTGGTGRRITIAASVAVLAVGAAGCGGSTSGSSGGAGTAAKAAGPAAPEVNPAGDIPDNQAYVPYTLPGAGVTVKVPEGWSRSTTGAAVVFTDKLNSIRAQAVPARTAPTVSTTRQTDVPKLAASTSGFKAGTVTSVSRKAGTAIRTTYLADAKADPVTGKAGTDAVERYVFFHRGKDVILTLSGPKGADNVDPWRIVTDSVRWTR